MKEGSAIIAEGLRPALSGESVFPVRLGVRLAGWQISFSQESKDGCITPGYGVTSGTPDLSHHSANPRNPRSRRKRLFDGGQPVLGFCAG